jgi:hypothetical protein
LLCNVSHIASSDNDSTATRLVARAMRAMSAVSHSHL